MDTYIEGMNKVYCYINNTSYSGKTVTISDGTTTWSQTLPSQSGMVTTIGCTFYIPPVPAGIKKRYTVILHNGNASAASVYSTTIDLGFGDSVRVPLYTGGELVDKAYYDEHMFSYTLPTASSSTKGGVKVGSGYGLYMDGEQVKSAVASSAQLGSVKVGSGLQANDAGTLSVKNGTGLEISSGSLKLKTATSSDLGGVMLGTGLSIDSGKISVKVYSMEKNAYVLSSVTIAAGDYATKTIKCSDSWVLNDRNKSVLFIGSITPSSGPIMASLYGNIQTYSDHIEIPCKFFNVSNSSYTIGTTDVIYVELYYLYSTN